MEVYRIRRRSLVYSVCKCDGRWGITEIMGEGGPGWGAGMG